MRQQQRFTTLVSKRPSPAMIVALIALFVSLTGNGLALSGKFTVDDNDLQPGAVHRYAIHMSAVNAARLGKVVVISQSVSLPHNDAGEGVSATCPIGSQLLGGGGRTGLFGVPLDSSYPHPDQGSWQVDAQNPTPDADGTLTAYAVCLK